ncbi:hypothetical protein NC651_007503 [Populus alba x Populus x berolinensis]|nr:hypothetical protein NC651_007482 [Populus alba x Populus x berolinensis]KAJ6941760.1 hypothetical protein NC651_007503 [Populus alba x Populus x berolinensis]
MLMDRFKNGTRLESQLQCQPSTDGLSNHFLQHPVREQLSKSKTVIRESETHQENQLGCHPTSTTSTDPFLSHRVL